MYKLCLNIFGEKPTSVIRTTDGACIPFDPANTDFIEFVKWLKDDGIPEAPDGGTAPTQHDINAIIAKLGVVS